MFFEKWLSLESRVWQASFLNVGAILFGIWEILKHEDATGVSVWMLGIFLYMQFTYAQAGKVKNLRGQYWGMALSAVATSIMIILTFVY